jgi:hypothetical protein
MLLIGKNLWKSDLAKKSEPKTKSSDCIGVIIRIRKRLSAKLLHNFRRQKHSKKEPSNVCF